MKRTEKLDITSNLEIMTDNFMCVTCMTLSSRSLLKQFSFSSLNSRIRFLSIYFRCAKDMSSYCDIMVIIFTKNK